MAETGGRIEGWNRGDRAAASRGDTPAPKASSPMRPPRWGLAQGVYDPPQEPATPPPQSCAPRRPDAPARGRPSRGRCPGLCIYDQVTRTGRSARVGEASLAGMHPRRQAVPASSPPRAFLRTGLQITPSDLPWQTASAHRCGSRSRAFPFEARSWEQRCSQLDEVSAGYPASWPIWRGLPTRPCRVTRSWLGMRSWRMARPAFWPGWDSCAGGIRS